MSAAIDFLTNLAKQLREQDNAYTASPNYCIEEERLITGIDTDYTDQIGWFDCEGGQAEGDEEKALNEAHIINGDVPDGWTRTRYDKTWRHTGISFLTKQSADAYVAHNAHRHECEIRVFVDSHYRNHEMREVRRLLAGPVIECIEALREIIGACEACDADDDKSLVDEFTEVMELRGKAALAALDTAKEPY